MILIANSEAFPGIELAAKMIKQGKSGIDAMVEGISLVEKSVEVRSVGYGGSPNILGEMEFDASVMDGDTLETGAVGGLKKVVSAAKVAKLVKEKLVYQILVGEGAKRFANEMGLKDEPTLYPDSANTWKQHLAEMLTEEELEKFPNVELSKFQHIAKDPEYVHDTTVFLCKDKKGTLSTTASTSGWAWKYPGRLGDSPICGAGFYADSRYGAVACTHTGEMTIRTGTSRTIINAIRFGYSLDEAINFAIEDLRRVGDKYDEGVVIHAIDKDCNHKVVNFHCPGNVKYWYWDMHLEKPELRDAESAD